MKRNMPPRHVLFALLRHAIVPAAAVAIFASHAASGAEDVNPDLAVTVSAARKVCFSDTIQVTGILVPRNEILVRPEREGLQISEVLVEPGASVSNGQALARLTPPEGSKSTGTVTVQAPAAGLVSAVAATIGTVASPQAPPLFRIVKGGEMELMAEAQGSALSRLAPNQTARVEIIGASELPGRVRVSSTTINPQTQLGTVNIFLGSNPRLRLGAFGRATIDVGRSCNPTVPLSAVLYGSDGTVVQVVRDSRVETRGVAVGLIQAGQAEITEGLNEGDVVVVRAGAFLKDGDRVRALNTARPAASN